MEGKAGPAFPDAVTHEVAGAGAPAGLDALLAFMERHPRLFVLTGAGISTDSGIPCYRDAEGNWTSPPPMLARDFVTDPAARRRYWARSMLGWPRIAAARPNAGHLALAKLEVLGRVRTLVTQNVDGLHQRAGSSAPLELHGNLHGVVCLDCGRRHPRAAVQAALARDNPAPVEAGVTAAPDGDAHACHVPHAFRVPSCEACGGVLKPDVVFFGEGVPRPRVEAARAALDASDAVLVVGSSLKVYSGYRVCEWAAARGLPIAILTRGRTRADALATFKVDGACSATLAAALAALTARGDRVPHMA